MTFYKKQISFKLLLLIVFLLFFLTIYFTPINSILIKFFNLNTNNVGANLVVGLISSCIPLIIPIFIKLLKKEPISIFIPSFKVRVNYFSTTDIKTNFNIKPEVVHQLIPNGILLKGNNIYPSTNLPFNKLGYHITACANFQAITNRNSSKYWRYGIELKNQGGKSLCLFHVDSDNFIILYVDSKLVSQFIDNTSLNKKNNNLKVMVSVLNNITNLLFYLNDNLIVQCSIINSDKIQIFLSAWSDNKRDHEIKIKNINVTLSE